MNLLLRTLILFAVLISGAAGQRVVPAAAGIFSPASYGRITDGGYFGDGLAHPASSNGFATLGALQATYSFATATSNDMAGLMIQAAINANDAAGQGYVSLPNGQYRSLPISFNFRASTLAHMYGSGQQTIILCQNAGTNPCVFAGNQTAQLGAISNLTLQGMNTLALPCESCGGALATNIYNPGTVGLFLLFNDEVQFENLNFYNFDSALDWDTTIGGAYLDTFLHSYFFFNNRGISISHGAANSFESMNFSYGAAGNNNYNVYIALVFPQTTLSNCTYNNGTGAVACVTAGAHGVGVGQIFNLTLVTGTGGFASLDSVWTATSGTTGTTLNFTARAGLGATTVTGGNIFAAGTGSSPNEGDIHINNFSLDYPNVVQVYYFSLAGQNDHLSSIYFNNDHIETSSTVSGTGCRMQNGGDMDFSQVEWFENSANSTGAVCHLEFWARTWTNGGKGPGLNLADSASMPFINTSSDIVSGGVGISGRAPNTALLLSNPFNGNAVGTKQTDPQWCTVSSAITVSVEIQGCPSLNASASLNVTVPPSTTSPFIVGTILPLVAYPGATVTVVAGAGVTVTSTGSGLTYGGAKGAAASLIQTGTNVWLLTGAN